MTHETIIWSGSAWSSSNVGTLVGATLLGIVLALWLVLSKRTRRSRIFVGVPSLLVIGSFCWNVCYETTLAKPKTDQGKLTEIHMGSGRGTASYVVLRTNSGEQNFTLRYSGGRLASRLAIGSCYKVEFIEGLDKHFNLTAISLVSPGMCTF
jgi:hypothetical protein